MIVKKKKNKEKLKRERIETENDRKEQMTISALLKRRFVCILDWTYIRLLALVKPLKEDAKFRGKIYFSIYYF